MGSGRLGLMKGAVASHEGDLDSQILYLTVESLGLTDCD